ncbi:MAG: hypothetical protein ACREKL_11855 [Chthoniobacterales bacterium]
MIRVLALTQFAFLSLGIVAVKIMVHANGNSYISTYLQALDDWVLWLFAVPLLWIAFASACIRINKGPLSAGVANATGIILAIASFLFLASVTFLA